MCRKPITTRLVLSCCFQPCVWAASLYGLVAFASPLALADNTLKKWPKADREVATDAPKRVTWTPVDSKQTPTQEDGVVANSQQKSSSVIPAAYEIDEFIDAPIDPPLAYPFETPSHGACNQNACDCTQCAPQLPVGLWVHGEYLLWSLDGMRLPALVTTSGVGTAPENVGVLGFPSTTVLIGTDTVNDEYRSGGKISFGWWDDRSRTAGFEASYLGLERSGETFRGDSSQTPNLARPYFDTLNNSNAALLIASPAFLSGSVTVATATELHAFEVMRRQRISYSHCHRVDFLLGYRHGQLEEQVRIDHSSLYTAPQGQIIAGTTRSLFDSFETSNRFHGAQVGMHYQHFSGPMKLHAIAKLGIGANRADVTIDGQTTTTVPSDEMSTFVGGLLAQSTNIGRFENTDFMVLPEVGLTLTTHLNASTQLSIGYNLMYWSKVARAADQIDLNVSQLPPEPPSGTRNPEFRFITDDFFAHGLQAGLQYEF